MSPGRRGGPTRVSERILSTDDVELCVRTTGDPGDPALLLISGMSASLDWWDGGLCDRLAAAGRFVVRYDHRDTGRSTTWPPGEPAYTADDLDQDALRVLDGVGVRRAHLVGVSMGGGISQQLAALHPDRVGSTTLIATSPAGARAGDTALPPPEPQVGATFSDPRPDPDWSDRAAVVEHLVEEQRPYAGALGFDEDRVRATAGQVVDRSRDVAAAGNHALVAGGGSTGFRMADIAVPTLVLHGTTDPLFPLAHGRAVAAEIVGARLVELAGMGHEVPPPPLWDEVVELVVAHTAAP
jgi:pimeloyl-ACP methyl ester carboxylesterase